MGLSDFYVDVHERPSILHAMGRGCGSIQVIYPGKATSKKLSSKAAESIEAETKVEDTPNR